MATSDKNYSGFVKLYTDPDTQTGYVGTMYFQILTKSRSARIRVWSEEEALNATWSISIKEGTTTWGTSGYLYQGELMEIDVTEQRPSANHYDEWEISVSAFESDDIGNLLYSGNYYTILGVPKIISDMRVSNTSPKSNQTIVLSWSKAESTNNIEFPIQGLIIKGHYFRSDLNGWLRAECFPENIEVQGEIINGILCSPDTILYNLNLQTLIPEELPKNPITFSINPFLYWEDLSSETEDYKITPIFGLGNTGAVRIYITFVAANSIIIYAKNSEGNFLLGETMFIKDSNGNWQQAESIQQN